MPHVGSNDPPPQELLQAQQQALLAYTKTLERRIAQFEEVPESPRTLSNEDTEAFVDAAEEEIMGHVTSGMTLKKQNTFSFNTDDSLEAVEQDLGDDAAMKGTEMSRQERQRCG